MEESKSLTALLVVAIIVSLGGTFVVLNQLSKVGGMPGITGLYGYNETTGTTSVTLGSTYAIALGMQYEQEAGNIPSDTTLSFGTGYVNESAQSCTLMSVNGSVIGTGCVGFSSTGVDGFVLENTGNTVWDNVTFWSNKNATTFIGGTNPEWKFNVTYPEPAACGTNHTNPNDWNDIPLSTSAEKLCENFNFGDDKDDIFVDVKIVIPQDATPATKQATLYFKAEAAAA